MSVDVPVIDPSEIPVIASGDYDWRGHLDNLRESYPFFRVGDDRMIWSTRYDAALEIFKNGELFWEGPFGTHTQVEGFGAPAWDTKSAEEGVQRHIHLRQALMPMFGPASVKSWEGAIEATCSELLDSLAGRGECDFVHDFASLYFPRIGADMLGAPRKDWDQLCEWEHEAFKVPPGRESVMSTLDSPATHSVIEYVKKLLEEKRKNPDGRFASFVAKLCDDGVITSAEATWAMNIFVFGSGHTVAAHLTYVFRYLADHPQLRSRLAAEPDCVNSVCEELLRLFPLGGHTRTLTADTVFRGLKLSKGDQLYINYTMINRDPRAHDFGRIDFDRKVNKHLAFNQGWRQCIGLFFARRARNIAVAEWHRRIPHYELDKSQPLYDQLYAGVGFHALPLRWAPVRSQA